jgi:hypothetical protein
MYIEGTGLEDFETYAHVFSLSNAVAAGTRHASAFHRHQAIEEYFYFWDANKYANLSKCATDNLFISIDFWPGDFLYNNYRQALQLISELSPEVDKYMRKGRLTDAAFLTFLNEERAYLSLPKNPRTHDNEMDVAYVEALEAVETAE